MKFDRGSYVNAFLFHSLYTSILLVFILSVHEYINETYENISNKIITNAVIMFMASFILLLILWRLFGWGHSMGSIKKVIKNRSKNYKRVNYKVDKQ